MKNYCRRKCRIKEYTQQFLFLSNLHERCWVPAVTLKLCWNKWYQYYPWETYVTTLYIWSNVCIFHIDLRQRLYIKRNPAFKIKIYFMQKCKIQIWICFAFPCNLFTSLICFLSFNLSFLNLSLQAIYLDQSFKN